MLDALIIVVLSTFAFMSTSLDNLLLLLGFMSHPQAQIRGIRVGYLAATGLVLMLSFATAYGAHMIPEEGVHYLGVVPIAFGLFGLWQLLRPGPRDTRSSLGPGAGLFTSLTVTLANSGDTLAVFASLFAETRSSLRLFILATGLACASLLIGVADRALSDPLLRARIGRVGPYLLPPILLIIGAYIFLDTATDIDL